MSPMQRGDIHVAAAPVSWGVFEQTGDDPRQLGPEPVSYTHLTLPTTIKPWRSRGWAGE